MVRLLLREHGGVRGGRPDVTAICFGEKPFLASKILGRITLNAKKSLDIVKDLHPLLEHHNGEYFVVSLAALARACLGLAGDALSHFPTLHFLYTSQQKAIHHTAKRLGVK